MMMDTNEIPLTEIVTREPTAPVADLDNPQLTRLGPLEAAKHLKIKQKIRINDLCGLCCCWDSQKKYAIQGSEGDTLYWAKESSSCCGRFWLANIRAMNISVVDQTGNEVMTLRRPLNCEGCCCWWAYPRCTQKLQVSIGGESIGFIRERATWCYPVFHLFDREGNFAMKIRGPLCRFICFQDVEFHVTNLDGVEIAKITKKWMGLCVDSTTDFDNFEIDFKTNLNVEEKAIIMAATILLDFMYFETE